MQLKISQYMDMSATLRICFFLAVCSGCQSFFDPIEPWPPSSTNCQGTAKKWDTDGDGISDRVEKNLANSYFTTGRCDRDPSRAIGKYWDGSLQGGVNLVDTNDGYCHYVGSDKIDSDDWATLTLVNCLEATGRAWEAHWQGSGRSSFPRIAITDLSRRQGGTFVPHVSHQNGLDVDLRYVRNDGKEWPLDIKTTPNLYDSAATLTLFRLFLQNCNVSFIMVDTQHIGFTNDDLRTNQTVLVHGDGHSNHFHLRLEKPTS